MQHYNVLAIAPYAGLMTVIESVAPEYPELNITVRLGDLEHGLSAAQSSFSHNFDAIVSRGGTAQILEDELVLPVVEIDLSIGDVLRQIETLTPRSPRLAGIGFDNTIGKLRNAADLFPCPLDIETVDFADEVPRALDRLTASHHATFLCDNIAYETALSRGLDAHLLVSGPESVRLTLDRVRFYLTQWHEGVEHNRLLWHIIKSQPGNLVIYSQSKELIFSDVPDEASWVLDELIRRFDDDWHRIVIQRSHRLWRIRRTRLAQDSSKLSMFSITSSREPIRAGRAGIEYMSDREVTQSFEASVFFAAQAPALVQASVEAALASQRPIMLRGEVGSGKDQIVKMLYLASTYTRHPYVSIDCSLITERSFTYLTESYTSPLYESQQTICLKCLHALNPGQWRELLAVVRKTGLVERNLVLLSGNDGEDGIEPEVLEAFTDQLGCHTLTVAPLRARPDGIEPALRGYLASAAAHIHRRTPQLDPDALQELTLYSWPNNYLQLRRIIDWILATNEDTHIGAADVSQALAREQITRFSSTSSPSETSTLDLSRPLDEIERDIAQLVLASCHNNRTQAARSLGISRTTLWRLLK